LDEEGQMENFPKKTNVSDDGRQQDLPLSWAPEADDDQRTVSPEFPREEDDAIPEQSPLMKEGVRAASEISTEQPDLVLEDEVPNPDAPVCVEFTQAVASVGRSLREARSNRSLTVAAVCAGTKIPTEFVKSIEADRLDDLPPMLYTKSYITMLCREYGIDPAPLVASLKGELPDGEDESTDGGHFVVTGDSGDNPSRVQYNLGGGPKAMNLGGGVNPAKILLAVIFGVLLVLVLGAAVMQVRLRWQRHRAANAAEAQPATEQSQAVEGAAGVVDLDNFIIPQQLPLKELADPES
jgi:hypothetical protein